LLGIIPFGLPEGLAGFQFPVAQQHLAPGGVEITGDLDVHDADQRARTGVDFQPQPLITLPQDDGR
jgi:hypothetical protein